MEQGKNSNAPLVTTHHLRSVMTPPVTFLLLTRKDNTNKLWFSSSNGPSTLWVGGGGRRNKTIKETLILIVSFGESLYLIHYSRHPPICPFMQKVVDHRPPATTNKSRWVGQSTCPEKGLRGDKDKAGRQEEGGPWDGNESNYQQVYFWCLLPTEGEAVEAAEEIA